LINNCKTQCGVYNLDILYKQHTNILLKYHKLFISNKLKGGFKRVPEVSMSFVFLSTRKNFSGFGKQKANMGNATVCINLIIGLVHTQSSSLNYTR